MTVSFDRVASIYDATRWAGVPPGIMEKLLSEMKKAFHGCQIILDIGTGTGRFAQFFNDTGFFVVGVDVSLSMMAKAREKGVENLVRADAHQLPCGKAKKTRRQNSSDLQVRTFLMIGE